jgi:hypothetical protein
MRLASRSYRRQTVGPGDPRSGERSYRQESICRTRNLTTGELMIRSLSLLVPLAGLLPAVVAAQEPEPKQFLAQHCYECHNNDTQGGGLNLTALPVELSDAGNFARWIKIHDRIKSGEMPPKGQQRPAIDETNAAIDWLKQTLLAAERASRENEPRTSLRRMTRTEYENTIRDLFDLQGIALRNDLPADGSAHGFDKNSDALDISDSQKRLTNSRGAAAAYSPGREPGEPDPPKFKSRGAATANTQSTDILTCHPLADVF